MPQRMPQRGYTTPVPVKLQIPGLARLPGFLSPFEIIFFLKVLPLARGPNAPHPPPNSYHCAPSTTHCPNKSACCRVGRIAIHQQHPLTSQPLRPYPHTTVCMYLLATYQRPETRSKSFTHPHHWSVIASSGRVHRAFIKFVTQNLFISLVNRPYSQVKNMM